MITKDINKVQKELEENMMEGDNLSLHMRADAEGSPVAHTSAESILDFAALSGWFADGNNEDQPDEYRSDIVHLFIERKKELGDYILTTCRDRLTEDVLEGSRDNQDYERFLKRSLAAVTRSQLSNLDSMMCEAANEWQIKHSFDMGVDMMLFCSYDIKTKEFKTLRDAY